VILADSHLVAVAGIRASGWSAVSPLNVRGSAVGAVGTPNTSPDDNASRVLDIAPANSWSRLAASQKVGKEAMRPYYT
jgi:hypothetical protein